MFRHILLSGSLVWAFSGSFSACAQESIGSSRDCTDVSVHYSDNAELTREERLKLMDKALFKSLNKFELCQSTRNGHGSSGTTGTSGADGEAGNSGEGTAGDRAGETGAFNGKSVATSGISGTEAPEKSMESEFLSENDMATTPSSMDESSLTANKKYQASSSGSGKLPDDIPEAANDDALAAQIRYAAENEPDPVKKARLWNEYRKYKGLPQK